MTKDFLKVGYFIETRNAGSGILIPVSKSGKEFCISDTCSCKSQLYSYNQDLTHKSFEDWDIVRVWGYSDYINVHFTPDGRELLWERKEHPELTENEIAQLETVLKMSEDHDYIARDDDGEVSVYSGEPFKSIHNSFYGERLKRLVEPFELEERENCFESLGNNSYLIADLLDNQ